MALITIGAPQNVEVVIGRTARMALSTLPPFPSVFHLFPSSLFLWCLRLTRDQFYNPRSAGGRLESLNPVACSLVSAPILEASSARGS